MGIDADGHMMVLREPKTFTIDQTRQVYIMLAFRMADHKPSATKVKGGGVEYFIEVEIHDLSPVAELPKTPYLEMARIWSMWPAAKT